MRRAPCSVETRRDFDDTGLKFLDAELRCLGELLAVERHVNDEAAGARLPQNGIEVPPALVAADAPVRVEQRGIRFLRAVDPQRKDPNAVDAFALQKCEVAVGAPLPRRAWRRSDETSTRKSAWPSVSRFKPLLCRTGAD